MVPVFASGFEDLQKRVQQLNAHSSEYQLRLREVSGQLDKLISTEQIDLYARLLKSQKKHVEVSHKILRVVLSLLSVGFIWIHY